MKEGHLLLYEKSIKRTCFNKSNKEKSVCGELRFNQIWYEIALIQRTIKLTIVSNCDLYLNFRITKWTLYHWIRESESNNNGIMLLQLITQVAKGRLYFIGTVSNRHIRMNMLSTTILKKLSCQFIVSYSNELVLKLVSGYFFINTIYDC